MQIHVRIACVRLLESNIACVQSLESDVASVRLLESNVASRSHRKNMLVQPVCIKDIDWAKRLNSN